MPSATPAIVSGVSRGPPKKDRSSPTMKSGTPAMRIAAMAEGTDRSAQVTRPFPPHNMSPPTITALRQNTGRTGAGLRSRAHRKSNTPARTNRAPAMRKGGTVSTPTRIAK